MNTQLSDLQKLQLEILKEFIRVCDALNLRYYLVEGTMLGAQRHQGFIPWDDDIDVGMPRKDYEIFQREAPKLLNPRYFMSNHRNNEKHYWMTIILFDKQNKVILSNATEKIESHVWIDVIPLEGMPDGAFRQKLHFYHYYYYRVLYNISHFSKIVNVNKPRPLPEKMVIKLLSIINPEKHINSVKVCDKLHKVLSKYDFDKSKYVMQIISEYKMKELMPREWFGNGKDYVFEGISAVGVSDSDKYLTKLYGDYLRLPPVEKRVGKHNAEIIRVN